MRPVILLLLGAALIFSACKKTDPKPQDDPYAPTPYVLEYPGYFPQLNIPADNQLTEEGIALGRKLYYDPIVHGNEEHSCASCHQQSNSFSSNRKTAIIPHINLGWNRAWLWKGEEEGTIEEIMEFEVADFFMCDVSKLQNHPEYPDDFYSAFGTRQITTELAGKALAQFLYTAISANSKFDRYLRGEEQLNNQEMLGLYLFNSEDGDCFHCHGAPMFSDYLFHNNGLDSTFEGINAGRYEITGNPIDKGRFKTPTLRNIELTAPYMHDDRFQTLEEVIDFYDSQVKVTPSVDPIMTKPGKEHGLELEPHEKAALVAFLKTLTDTSYINNPDLSNPF